jgi:hypothetical protein
MTVFSLNPFRLSPLHFAQAVQNETHLQQHFRIVFVRRRIPSKKFSESLAREDVCAGSIQCRFVGVRTPGMNAFHHLH